MKFGIIAVGYNRPNSMKQLLSSLCNALYYEHNVDLIISIDKSDRQDEVVNVANECSWDNGDKILRVFSEKQGLRRHILQCGNLTEIYDAVVVLEDDLIVSKYFFKYVIETVDFYKDDERIAGISLYLHKIHPGVRRPFEPVNNGYDAFIMQYAMSWGQCWTKKMWNSFKKWYSENENIDLGKDNLLPDYIAKWNDQSWLKYYMRYIVETNKYFVYPYIGLSTNASDVGEHCIIPNNDYQISFLQGEKEYELPKFENSIKYDVYFERKNICDSILTHLQGVKVLDLYGNRSTYYNADYVISTRQLPYEVVEEYALKFRPIEVNCQFPEKGDGIVVYNLHKISKNKYRINKNILTRYEVKAISWKRLLLLGFNGFFDSLKRKIGG